MLLMRIPLHVSRTCWTNIGLILNMIVLINVCFMTMQDPQTVPFPCNYLILLKGQRLKVEFNESIVTQLVG